MNETTMGPIYVASSWKNDGPLLDSVHEALHAVGVATLDFRAQGRWWGAADEDKHPITGRALTSAGKAAFDFDMGLMRASVGCLAVHPCGIATALEAGHFHGAGKPLVIWGTPREVGLDITWQMGALFLGRPLSEAIDHLVKLLGGAS